jgi:hypothetical protein
MWEMVYFCSSGIYLDSGFQVAMKDEEKVRYTLELVGNNDNCCDIFRAMTFQIPGTLVNIPEAETIHGEEIMNEIKKKI